VRSPRQWGAYFLPPSGGHALDGRAFEGHWGPLCPPFGAPTRDEQWTVCRDMIRGGSNGMRRISLALLAPAHRHIDLPAAGNRPAPRANRARAFRCLTKQPSRRDRARPDVPQSGHHTMRRTQAPAALPSVIVGSARISCSSTNGATPPGPRRRVHLRRRQGLAGWLPSELVENCPQRLNARREGIAVVLDDVVKLLGESGGFFVG
jgi:hypothetical protein